MSSAPEGERNSDEVDVLVLGASFAGVELLYQLRKRAAGRRLSVAVVDRQETHGYIPLVQERLCGRLGLPRSRLNTRAYVEADERARYVVGEITGFDPERREVQLADGGRLRGRFVVVALGSVVAPPDSLPGREEFVGYKLAAEFGGARERLKGLLSGDAGGSAAPRIVVVGGGISGVELAGELADLARERPPGWRAPKVLLIHGGPRLLPGLTPRAGAKALKFLRAQGAEVRLSTRLQALRHDEVVIRPSGAGPRRDGKGPYRDGEDETASCDMAFWAGGLRPAPALARLGLPRTDDGWLRVGPTLQCFPESHTTRPGVFACGDAARVFGGAESGEFRWPTMQRAIECLWQANLVARNISLLAAGSRGTDSVPPLDPHVLRTDFFHGVSVGARSMIVYGPLALELGRFAIWFRRFLMRQYFARYS